MKKIIFGFLVLLATVWLGIAMHRDSGYVLITYHNYIIETSLWLAAVIVLAFFVVFYMLLRFSSGVNAIVLSIRRWIGSRRKRYARAQTILGLYDLIEGNWRSAEKKLLRGAKHGDMALINYLAAALTAQKQHELKRCDSHLRLAQKVARDRPLAVSLAQAGLQIGKQAWQEARATLQNIQVRQPKNIFILQLLKQVYLELKDWSNLEKLLPILRKRRALMVDEINQLEKLVYQELLIMRSKTHAITSSWHDLPRYLQKDPALVAIYAEYLLVNNQREEAETVLKMTLHRTLDKGLLELYAKLSSPDPIKQLMRAEKWLLNNQENADLLLCLGRLCREQKLWGKARHYLEKSSKLAPSAASYGELAQIMVEQNDLRAALDFYAKGRLL